VLSTRGEEEHADPIAWHTTARPLTTSKTPAVQAPVLPITFPTPQPRGVKRKYMIGLLSQNVPLRFSHFPSGADFGGIQPVSEPALGLGEPSVELDDLHAL
jgi:hypothetical protein